MLRTVCVLTLIVVALAAPGCISVKTEGPAPTKYAAADVSRAAASTGDSHVDVD